MQIIESLINLIYPPTCGFCGKINTNYICNSCMQKLELIKQEKNNYYFHSQIYFQEHFYLFNYSDDIRNKIIQYKFNEKSYLYKTFAMLFIKNENFKNFIKNYNYLTSVPLHKKRYKTRGYNQSELIAKEIANNLNIPYLKSFLIKKKNIVAQSTLNKEQRQNNITDAFEINKTYSNFKILNQKKIAIFDDIFTTGATANECAKTLKQFGFKKIGIITLAKD